MVTKGTVLLRIEANASDLEGGGGGGSWSPVRFLGWLNNRTRRPG